MTRRDKLRDLLNEQRSMFLNTRNDVIKAMKAPSDAGMKTIDEHLSALIVTNASIAELLEIEDIDSFQDLVNTAKQVNFLTNLYNKSPGD